MCVRKVSVTGRESESFEKGQHSVSSQCVFELSDIMNFLHIDVFAAVADLNRGAQGFLKNNLVCLIYVIPSLFWSN